MLIKKKMMHARLISSLKIKIGTLIKLMASCIEHPENHKMLTSSKSFFFSDTNFYYQSASLTPEHSIPTQLPVNGHVDPMAYYPSTGVPRVRSGKHPCLLAQAWFLEGI